MKKLAVALLAFLSAFTIAGATTFYLDGGCNNDGDGGCNGGTPPNCVCATGAGLAGPFNILPSAVAAALAPGDIIKVRGTHVKDAGEGANHKTGTFDGTYNGPTDVIISGKNGSAGNNIVMEASGWTANDAYTQETVFFEDVTDNFWNRCTDCSSGVCSGVPTDICSQTYWRTNPSPRPYAVRGDLNGPGRVPAISVGSVNQLFVDPALLSENAKQRCSKQLWLLCNTTRDCDNKIADNVCEVGTNPAATTVVTTFFLNDTNNVRYPHDGPMTVLATWGPTLPTDSYLFNTDGNVITFLNSSFWTIRGINFRFYQKCGIRALKSGSNTSDEITVQDNGFSWGLGTTRTEAELIEPKGGVCFSGLSAATITSNDFYASSVPAVEVWAATSGASAYTITNNFSNLAQGLSDGAGAEVYGTTTSFRIGSPYMPVGTRDYTGSSISGNIIVGSPTAQFTDGVAMAIYGDARSLAIHSNIFDSTGPTSSLRLSPGLRTTANAELAGTISDLAFYNNVFLFTTGFYSWEFEFSNSLGVFSNNTFANNTMMGSTPIFANGVGVTPTGTKIINNIFSVFSNPFFPAVSWSETANTTFDRNVIYDGFNNDTLVRWGGSNHGCTDTMMATFNDGGTLCPVNTTIMETIDVPIGSFTNYCGNPSFVSPSSGDAFVFGDSAAVNNGTATGVPAARTASINNTIALNSRYGYPNYAQNLAAVGTIDIGAVEMKLVNAAMTAISGPPSSWDLVVGICANFPSVFEPSPCSGEKADGTFWSDDRGGVFPSDECFGIRQEVTGLDTGRDYKLILHYMVPPSTPLAPFTTPQTMRLTFSALTSGGNCDFDLIPPTCDQQPCYDSDLKTWYRNVVQSIECIFRPSAATGEIKIHPLGPSVSDEIQYWSIKDIVLE